MDSVQNQAPILNSPYYYESALTPESMMVYLTTRLGSVDAQIQRIFTSQQQSEKIRAAMNKLKELLGELDQSTKKEDDLHDGQVTLDAIRAVINEEIEAIDPDLARRLRTDLNAKGYILFDENDAYKTVEIENTREYFGDRLSELEST